MDIILGNILYSQRLVTQILLSSYLPIKQITPTFPGKTVQVVKNTVGKLNKKFEFNLFCHKPVLGCKYLFNRISTMKYSPLTVSLSSNHPIWSCKVVLTKWLFVSQICHSFRFWVLSQLNFYIPFYNLRCLVLSQLWFVSFVKTRCFFFSFCQKLTVKVLSHLKFASFVNILGVEFGHHFLIYHILIFLSLIKI